MKRIVIFGASGSIGDSAFRLLRGRPDLFTLVGASAHSRFDALSNLCARDFPDAKLFDSRTLPESPHPEELISHIEQFLYSKKPDIVLNAVLGFAGIFYSLAALRRGIPLALANKESLVAGGDILMAERRRTGAPILPVDSEHSAMFQCLRGRDYADIRTLHLTCSGGPFRGQKDLSAVTKAQALRHPTWDMGAAITIGSATLANKCLEVFEAMHLFGVPHDRVQIVVHPQSVVHSLVEFSDGNTLAQLGPPDMLHPIAYALGYPDTVVMPPDENFSLLGRTLTFEDVDETTFRTIGIMRHCAGQGGGMPAVFNAVNEVATQAFLQEKIAFTQIFDALEAVISATKPERIENLHHLVEIDQKARQDARTYLEFV